MTRSSADLAVVIVNYRTSQLVVDCLASLESEIDSKTDVALVVDNASGDGSADRLEREIATRGWGAWAQLIRSETNGGFSAGNNIGIRTLRASHYLLLNSDTLVRAGALAPLRNALAEDADLGLVGPRLEWPDRSPQVSAFRDRKPFTEFLRAAATGALDRFFARYVSAMPIPDRATDASWLSFAAVMIRGEVVEQIGLLDEGYFMFFEDVDLCRRARDAGWRVRHLPESRVVHLRGGSSPVKSLAAQRKRLPAYYYASRARYYAKFHGRIGLWWANGLWTAGRGISWLRELIGSRPPHVVERELLDNWSHSLQPMQPPQVRR
jgi:N-acetylglucosaminyl-diphospho-decaprenol L-rhamnosyltransferase